MKIALRLAAIAAILTLAPAAFAEALPVDASTIAVNAATLDAPSAPPASVPEPAALAPIAGAIIVALRRRRPAAGDRRSSAPRDVSALLTAWAVAMRNRGGVSRV